MFFLSRFPPSFSLILSLPLMLMQFSLVSLHEFSFRFAHPQTLSDSSNDRRLGVSHVAADEGRRLADRR